MNDLADKDLLKEKMHAADLFCDATGVGMHPLEDLSNIPDPSFFKKDLIVTDTVYAPRETVMMKQAKKAEVPKNSTKTLSRPEKQDVNFNGYQAQNMYHFRNFYSSGMKIGGI